FRKSGRVEQAVEANRRRNIRATPRQVQRAHAAKAIAGNDNAAALDFVLRPCLLKDRLQAAQQGDAVGLQAIELAEHRVAVAPTELLAEGVSDEGVVTELDELLAEPDLEVRHAHYRRDQDNGR